ncbi:hypothetical protein GON03_18085 [Nocardioides sp. MAH-18]|uniref:Uncharacterized protein n=1 Tax=Nocardioides agri TaxID=2682843 RepID=A0A6L6XXC4_9ACTN|nr:MULTISPECIES: hypothetical protein [unclassified Nocardioides]MBA2956253.1 hypothetical protein [Nocardioides sp. CGMCC 1.13656]MVQ51096.1 hypothetical protein [Nocardioides sp. MAH-18]
MSDVRDYEVPDERRTWIYWTAAALLVLLIVISLFTFDAARSTVQAQDKAGQLIAALEKTGARTPSEDQVVRVLGSDGGAICEDPGEALRRATLYGMLTNGAAGPGQRPVIADKRVVEFQLLVVQIYCPDELDDFRDAVDDLDLDEGVID